MDVMQPAVVFTSPLAARVGRAGKVTAIDLATLFTAAPRLPHLKLRRHDILAEGLETDFYDLVDGGLLLVNIGNVELALTRMMATLRPGGWLIVEEPGDPRFPALGESPPSRGIQPLDGAIPPVHAGNILAWSNSAQRPPSSSSMAAGGLPLAQPLRPSGPSWPPPPS